VCVPGAGCGEGGRRGGVGRPDTVHSVQGGGGGRLRNVLTTCLRLGEKGVGAGRAGVGWARCNQGVQRYMRALRVVTAPLKGVCMFLCECV
jgi:hypothetical protein